MAVSPTRSFAYNYSSSSAGSSPTSSSSSTCSSSSPSSPSSTPSSTHSPSSLLLLRSSVNMACQAQMNVIAFVVDLIQYASEYMDIIIQKNLSEGAGGEGETRGEHSPQSRGSPPTTLRSSTGVQRSLGSTTPSSPRSTSPHFRSVRWVRKLMFTKLPLQKYQFSAKFTSFKLVFFDVFFSTLNHK